MRIRFALFYMLLGSIGCHAQIIRRSLETAPGGHQDPQGRFAIIGEMDDCYIDEIDYVPVGKHPDDKSRIDLSLPVKIYYRQFKVRPGTHVVRVHYFLPRGQSILRAGPVDFLTQVENQHVYMLQSDFKDVVTKSFLGLSVDNYYFRPKLIEDNQPVPPQH